MDVKCLHCSKVNQAEDWDKETERTYGSITSIKKGLKSNNWFYICPDCGRMCFKNDREGVKEPCQNTITAL